MEPNQEVDRIMPEIEGHIGTPEVAYQEVGSVLSQAGTALDMVRASSFGGNLTNIAYIYNTSESGAFGVFDPNLDRSVKVKLVEDRMASMGYETKYIEGSLYAWSDEKTPEEVKQQMEEMYRSLEINGGLVIGINASKILDVAQRNFDDLNATMQAGGDSEGLDQSDLDQLIALHLGSTIVHESVHALGDEGEDGPIAAQQAWVAEIMPKMNSERVAAGKSPLEISDETYTASSRLDVKTAQTAGLNDYVLPEVLLNVARGEDPLQGVKREVNDSMEAVLSRNHHDPIDPEFTTEKELEKDRSDKESSRMILEDLLDENRPHPVILPIRKSAGINSNIGGPFISSPFSVDEMIPRVLDGRDIQDKIDYKEGEDPYWHYRYKPENVKWKRDRMGRMTYQYDERLRIVDYDNNGAQTWDMLFREDIVTGPWHRMGAKSGNKGPMSMMRKIGRLKNLVRSGKKKAVRMICDRNLTDRVLRAISDMKFSVFSCDDKDSVWAYGSGLDESEIVDMEICIQEGRKGDVVNEFMGTASDIRDSINSIVNKVRDISLEHGIRGVYIVGGFPRTLASDMDFLEVNDLDFTSGRPDECLKLGGLVASEFNSEASIYHRTMTMSFEALGIKMDFRGNFVSQDVRPLMREAGIAITPLNYDIYARDFTVNSLIYDPMENKIYDITGNALEDLERKIIRTHFDPIKVIPGNPLIVTRAIIMNMRGYAISDDLYEAMKKLSHLLFEGDISDVRIAYEYDKIAKYEDADFMLKEFNLQKMKDINDRVRKESPELFED